MLVGKAEVLMYIVLTTCDAIQLTLIDSVKSQALL